MITITELAKTVAALFGDSLFSCSKMGKGIEFDYD